MPFLSINPFNLHEIQSYPQMSFKEAERVLDQTNLCFETWHKTSFETRSSLFLKLAEILLEKKENLARLITLEMGKPITQSKTEIEKCAGVCRFYAEHAEEFLKEEPVLTDAKKSFISYQPLGVILGVMPWNFPFWQVFRFAAPTLMAGNAIVLKHAPNVLGSAFQIEKLFCEVGFPKNLFSLLPIPVDFVDPLIAHPVIQAVTLTGSTAAGRKVAASAGRALKKAVLELGGSDPFIVFQDADLELALDTAVRARMVNTGQSCIAAKRFIVVDSLRKDFEEGLVARFRRLKGGDPLDETSDYGPLARLDLRDTLHQQVLKSIESGARLLVGGVIPDHSGAFYPATVLSDVQKGMPAYEEELFGPVAAILPVRNEEEAICVANDTAFGLGATLFTSDLRKGEEILKNQIKAGSCFLNAQVHSDFRLPFGGIKTSGYGRELGVFGMREFVNIKTVVVEGD